ncbi:MAG: hypothetical protein JW723_01295 [Bacteroidales bacterium]|nr:hypothetical protein [Bacteroidales bacterium]
MEYLRIALLILAYTIGIATIVVQIICYLKQIEYIETILFSASFLLLILMSTLQEFGLFANNDTTSRSTLLSSVLLIVFSTTIPVNIHKERIIRYPVIKSGLFLITALILCLIVISLHLKGELKETNIIISVYLSVAILYSMFTVLMSKPSVLIRGREKQERFVALVIIISVVLSMPFLVFVYRNDLWMNYLLYSPYFLSAICIFLCLFKLPDDIRRLFLFSVRSEIETTKLDNYQITSRETEVLKLLVQGKSYKEIGDALFISIPTVKTHVTNIYQKLKVKNKVELANLLK